MVPTNLKLLIETLNLSQRQFATKLNLDAGYLSRILNGKSEPPERILLLVESVFDVDGDWLRTGKGDMFKENGLTPLKRELLYTVDSLNQEDAQAVLDFALFIKEKYFKYNS